jgi:hypothetical protein
MRRVWSCVESTYRGAWEIDFGVNGEIGIARPRGRSPAVSIVASADEKDL